MAGTGCYLKELMASGFSSGNVASLGDLSVQGDECWRTVAEDWEPPRKEEPRMASSAVTVATVYSWLLIVHAHSVVSTLCDPVDCSPPGSSVHGIFQARNTAVGCHFLLQGIFLTQGSYPGLLCLLHWQAGSLLQCHVGSWILMCKLP